MDMAVLRSFFLWCTIINGGLLLVWFLLLAGVGDWVYELHSRWFPMSREAFSTVMYAAMAAFKMMVIIFNLTPYIALCIIG